MKTKNTPQFSLLISIRATRWIAAVATISLFASPVLGADGTWNTGSGAWGTAGNWASSVVGGGTSSIVTFPGPAAFGTSTVTLDSDRIVGVLNLGTSYSNYDLATGTAGQLTFDNGASVAELNFGGINFKTISAPVILASSLDIDSSGGTSSGHRRTISGNITAAGGADAAKVITHTAANAGGGDLWITGNVSDGSGNRKISIHENAANGLMQLSGNNSFSGGVRVSAGILQIGSNANALGSGILTLDGGNLEIVNFVSLSFGNNTEIESDTNIRLLNGGTGNSRTWTLGTLTLGNHTVTVNNTGGALNPTNADTLVFGSTTLTGDATFSVEQTGATVPELHLGALNGSSNLTKTGNGIINLTAAAGSYSGTTTLNAGTMVVGHNTALGSGKVAMTGTGTATLQIGTGITVANDITYSNTNASSAIERVVSGSSSFNVGTSGALTSDFVGGTDNTTAALRTGSGATTLTMSFAPTATASNDGSRISDVFDLSLTTSQTFVLQLSTGVSGSDPLYLGWLDGGAWVEATTGNTGAGGLAGQYVSTWDAFLAGNGGTFNASTMLGAYGYDATTSTAWAVLNHNSEFALVVPEPSTVVLCGLGLSFMLFRLRPRRQLS